VKNLPSAARAERNQERKLRYVPVWPVLAAVIVVVALVAFLR